MAKKITFRKILFIARICGLLFLICVFFLTSCAKPLYKDTFIISGTYLEVTSPSQDAAKIVYEEFRRLDKIFNFYDPQSEISRLNNTYNIPLRVSMELIEVLQLSHKFYDLSDGAFDVSCGNLYAFWKELIKKGKIKDFPSKEKIAQLKNTCGMENIEVNVPRGTVLIKKGGLKIDLGAIAIGYMVDRAVAKLKEKGIKNALINAGGDIYCLGNNRDRPWKVGIKDPKNDGSMVASENLIDRAITTSGNYEQFFEFPAAGRKNKRYSHLIDPHTGFPVENGILSVSVIADDCLSADSLATSFFVMGIEGIKKFIAKNNLEIKILVVSDNEKAESVFVFN